MGQASTACPIVLRTPTTSLSAGGFQPLDFSQASLSTRRLICPACQQQFNPTSPSLPSFSQASRLLVVPGSTHSGWYFYPPRITGERVLKGKPLLDALRVWRLRNLILPMRRKIRLIVLQDVLFLANSV